MGSKRKVNMTTEEEDIINKKKERVFDLLWSQEEQRTILGLLKSRKIKKEAKKENEVNMT